MLMLVGEVPAEGRCPGIPLSLPQCAPGDKPPEPRPAGSDPRRQDPGPNPYLPQHFPAVGTEQVVGGGRRAAAAPVHRGCGRRGESGRRAGSGLSLRPLQGRSVPPPPAAIPPQPPQGGMSGGEATARKLAALPEATTAAAAPATAETAAAAPHRPVVPPAPILQTPAPARLGRAAATTATATAAAAAAASQCGPASADPPPSPPPRSGTAPPANRTAPATPPGRQPAANEQREPGWESCRPIAGAEEALNLRAS
ncbi:basic proline-rich protein-like [Pongo pygmaeus]|uniref:basic proline-rich protein-like n=1 Tax=Pongo pygmaeus TaxID=9600 RepID=UPI00300D8397